MMSDESTRPSMTPPVETRSPAGPNRLRRRLLVGAASVVPSVYTLSSGAQVAVASNLRCLQEPAVPPQRFTQAPDHWLRAPVYVGRYENGPAYCVTSPQEMCTDVWNPNKGADGSQWVDGAGDMHVVGPNDPVTMANGPRQYGLIYVDREGTIAALDPNAAADIQPATQTCWASVMGSWNAKLG
jgi:hypothetical protein